MELLLAVFLLALFLGALAFSFGKLQPQGHLQEGRDRFESLLRMAKAHAVYSGRKLQIQFIPDDSNPLKAHWHLIDGGEHLAALPASSKLLAHGALLKRLHDAGRERALSWLHERGPQIGRRSTLDLIGACGSHHPPQA